MIATDQCIHDKKGIRHYNCLSEITSMHGSRLQTPVGACETTSDVSRQIKPPRQWPTSRRGVRSSNESRPQCVTRTAVGSDTCHARALQPGRVSWAPAAGARGHPVVTGPAGLHCAAPCWLITWALRLAGLLNTLPQRRHWPRPRCTLRWSQSELCWR